MPAPLQRLADVGHSAFILGQQRAQGRQLGHPLVHTTKPQQQFGMKSLRVDVRIIMDAVRLDSPRSQHLGGL
jgi:hypothetical protein